MKKTNFIQDSIKFHESKIEDLESALVDNSPIKMDDPGDVLSEMMAQRNKLMLQDEAVPPEPVTPI